MMEIHPEHTRVEPEEKPSLILPVLIWLGIIVGASMLIISLSGA